MTDRELMQMVLEELEELADVNYGSKTVLQAVRDRLAQPEREWVGLTDEERWEVTRKKWWNWEDEFDIEGFARVIEAKLREKNT